MNQGRTNRNLWSNEEIRLLVDLTLEWKSAKEIASILGRSAIAITTKRSSLVCQGLLEPREERLKTAPDNHGLVVNKPQSLTGEVTLRKINAHTTIEGVLYEIVQH
jgi:hypothetical protein